MPEKIKVLIVDDSAYMRVVLKDMLESDPGISVVGSAKDGVEAIEKVKTLAPDVVLLDIQMPKMDGIATLQRIMKESPARTVMLSAMDKVDDQLPLRALEMGAVDFISKPSGPVSIDIVHFTGKIVEIVKTAAEAKVEVLRRTREPLLTKKVLSVKKEAFKGRKVVVIGASTGGPRALEIVFAALPRDLPASFIVVQHLPPEFSASFAKRLDAAKGPRVVVACEGDRVEKGVAYLAPGGRHLKLCWKGAASLVINLDDGEPINFVRPSVDVLFRSAAESLRENLMAIILTGMGVDGTAGAMVVKASGGRVVVQDEHSSVAYSMPKSAIDAGLVDLVLPLDKIAEEIVNFLQE
jgi:two-component system chemotaxis response regulator CheB